MSSPTPKCILIEQEEAETVAWIKHKMTKALDQLELISLQESIIQKAWARWEEGLRIAHRQWEIGEAAMRMKTTSEQPILALKLSEGESKWYRMWRR